MCCTSSRCCVVTRAYLVYIPQPFDDVIKCFLVRDVVHEHDAHGAAVVRRGDGVEPLLPCRVPYLELYLFSAELYRLYFEVNTYKS